MISEVAILAATCSTEVPAGYYSGVSFETRIAFLAIHVSPIDNFRDFREAWSRWYATAARYRPHVDIERFTSGPRPVLHISLSFSALPTPQFRILMPRSPCSQEL